MARQRFLFAPAMAVACVGTCVSLATADTHTLVLTESVDNYTACCPGNSCANLLSNEAMTNFRNEMVASPNTYGFSNFYPNFQDNSVYDTDFLDPELNLHAPGSPDDTDNFDRHGFGISFYAGHGADLPKTTLACTNGASQCTQANAPAGTYDGQSGLGACAISPMSVTQFGANKGICNYSQVNTVNPTIDTCSTYSTNSNHAQFGYMALGETTATGGWRGAGTNGGTSLALLHMSFSMWTFFPETSWGSMFAGVHLIGGYMTSWDDINGNAVNYGTDFATSYQVNPNGEVQQAWVNVMSQDVGEGGGCTGSGSPSGGFNGCGCTFIMTISSSSLAAYAAFHEDWQQLTEDFPSQNGSGYWYWNALCNYNTSTYPWSGGD